MDEETIRAALSEWGRIRNAARNKKLTPEQRRAIATKASHVAKRNRDRRKREALKAAKAAKQ